MSTDYIIFTDFADNEPEQLELELTEPDITVASDTVIDLSNYGAACDTITMNSTDIGTITLPTYSTGSQTYTVGYGGIGTSGQVLTSNGTSNYQWSTTTSSPIFTVGGGSNESSIRISGAEPKLATDAGSVNVNDVIDVVNAMKQMIVEMAKDDELPEKYQWVKDIAHDWMIKALKGPESTDEENN